MCAPAPIKKRSLNHLFLQQRFTRWARILINLVFNTNRSDGNWDTSFDIHFDAVSDGNDFQLVCNSENFAMFSIRNRNTFWNCYELLETAVLARPDATWLFLSNLLIQSVSSLVGRLTC